MVIHKNRNTVLKFILFLYLLYFVLSYINGVWFFGGDKYGMNPIYTSNVNNIRLVYLIAVLALGIYEMVLHIRKLAIVDQLLMIVFFVLTLVKLFEVSQIVDTQTLLFQSGTPMMYLVFLFFFVGMDDKVEEDLLKLSKIYALIYLSLTILWFLDFCADIGYSVGVRFQSSPILYSFNNGLFFLIYALYNEKNHRTPFWKVLLSLVVVATFITTSRGWLLQTVIIFMMYFLLRNRGKRVILNIIKTALVIFGLVIIIRIAAPDVVNGILSRMGQSTRSSQLEAFFAQVPLTVLITGLGYNASYSFSMWEHYQFIDNQIIFSAFRYGIVIIGIMTYFLIKPFFISLTLSPEDRLRSFGVVHFVLAMLGLSIYFALAIDSSFLVAYALAGRMYMNARNIQLEMESSEDDEEIDVEMIE